jgi:hypothetical protein
MLDLRVPLWLAAEAIPCIGYAFPWRDIVRMSIDLYYFSGSGNTLFVAKQLNERLPDSRLIPIVGLLSNTNVETDATSIGIISPLHGMTLPVPVDQFLRKLCVGSAKYIFAITTRGGTI